MDYDKIYFKYDIIYNIVDIIDDISTYDITYKFGVKQMIKYHNIAVNPHNTHFSSFCQIVFLAYHCSFLQYQTVDINFCPHLAP